MVVEPFQPKHLEGFRALFDASSSTCFCRYWHFQGTKNEWLNRCAHRPEENWNEQREALERDEPSARGLVAFADPEVLGWMKLTPREANPKLTSLPVYRHIPFIDRTWSIGCFLVAPASRHRGVARALVRGAIEHVRAWGGRAVEGYPRRSEAPLYDEEAWQGPERLFVELGFDEVPGMGPYPLYRKVLE